MAKSRSRTHQGDPGIPDSLKKRKADDGAGQLGRKRKKATTAAAAQPAKKPPPTRTKAPSAKKAKPADPKSRKLVAAKKHLFADGDSGSEDDEVDAERDSFSGSSGSDDDEEVVDALGDDFLRDAESDSDDDVYDSEEDGQARPIFSDDEGESDAEEKLTAANIAGLSRQLDAEMEAEAEENEAELRDSALQTNLAGEPKVHLLGDVDMADGDELGGGGGILPPPDVTMLRARITDNIRILKNFKNLHEEGRSRSEYTQQLLSDICAYYGYSPFLAEKLFNLFEPLEAFDFFEANEMERPKVIRANTLKTTRRELAQALINRGFTVEPVEGKWSKVGLKVLDHQLPIGATPEYLAGHYILQAASSFLSVIALAPQENERILDMAAAPGGKTTYISALMKNTGCVFANDPNRDRAKGLIGNISRLGVRNTIVCNYDAREFPRVIGGFDRVLIDAPCSGTGVISKDPRVKTDKTEKDFLKLPHLQKQLLLSAIDSVDHASGSGGYVVYSTCSVTVEENEQVVEYALAKRPNVKLVETGLAIGIEGFTSYRGKKFSEKMKWTRRYYPHKYNMDGFFVAKFKKTGPSPAPKKDPSKTDGEVQVDAEEQDGEEGGAEDAFEGFDEEEDRKILEKAEKKRLKKKGLNPKAHIGNASANGKAKEPKKSETDTTEDKANGHGETKAEAPRNGDKKADSPQAKKKDKKKKDGDRTQKAVGAAAESKAKPLEANGKAKPAQANLRK